MLSYDGEESQVSFEILNILCSGPVDATALCTRLIGPVS